MVFRHISADLTLHALHLHEDLGWELYDVAEILGFSIRFFYRWKACMQETGTLTLPPHSLHGCPQALAEFEVRDIQDLLAETPYLYLDEIQEWLDLAHDHNIH